MRFRTLAIVNTLAFVAILAMNFLAQSADIFPYTTTELGESRAIFFLPSGYVFAIWGVIYLGLGAYITYQLRPANYDNPIHEQISIFFIVSCIANVTWLILFLNNLIWESTVAMLVLLASLLAIYTRLDIGRTRVTTLEKWAVHIPFSIYLGWITVATVANFAAALYTSGNVTALLGITADVWAVIMMAVAAVLAALMLIIRRDIAYALVVVWALIGIYTRPFDTPTFEVLSSLNSGLVDTAALVIAIAIAIGAAARLFVRRPQPTVA